MRRCLARIVNAGSIRPKARALKRVAEPLYGGVTLLATGRQVVVKVASRPQDST